MAFGLVSHSWKLGGETPELLIPKKEPILLAIIAHFLPLESILYELPTKDEDKASWKAVSADKIQQC